VLGEWSHIYWGGIWEDLMFQIYVVVVRTLPFHSGLSRSIDISVHRGTEKEREGKCSNEDTAIVHIENGWLAAVTTYCSPEIKNGKIKMMNGNLDDGENVGDSSGYTLRKHNGQVKGSMLRIVQPFCCRIRLGLNFHGLP